MLSALCYFMISTKMYIWTVIVNLVFIVIWEKSILKAKLHMLLIPRLANYSLLSQQCHVYHLVNCFNRVSEAILVQFWSYNWLPNVASKLYWDVFLLLQKSEQRRPNDMYVKLNNKFDWVTVFTSESNL